MEWISVENKEKRPQEGELCLIYGEDSGWCFLTIGFYEGNWDDYHNGCWREPRDKHNGWWRTTEVRYYIPLIEVVPSPKEAFLCGNWSLGHDSFYMGHCREWKYPQTCKVCIKNADEDRI